MMTLPAHLATANWARRCCGHGVEIGDREAEGGISFNREAERSHRIA